MAKERIFYADENDVAVTESTLRVRKHTYQLDRIYQHRVSTFKPNRTPGRLFVGLGFLSLSTGLTGKAFQLSISSLQFLSGVLSLDALLIVTGTFLMVCGIVLMMAVREKYGVHIVMGDEEKDVLVSERKEYVLKVEDALNTALTVLFDKNRRDRNQMSTSHR